MNRRAALRSVVASVAAVGLAGCQGALSRIPQVPRIGPPRGDRHPLSLAVQDALRQSPLTSTVQLDITTREDSIIVLTGLVDNDTQFYEVERIARSVEGVEQVNSQVYVEE